MNLRRKVYTYGLNALMAMAAVAVIGVATFIVVYVCVRGFPRLSWQFLSTKPSYLKGNIGILGDILNTLALVLATTVIELPLGVGAAVYLNEYAKNKRLVAVIEYAAETLSAIPSIIFGLVGMLFFCQFLKMRTSILAGAMTLVIMNLPTLIRTTQESLKAVPAGLREGSRALGAGKWVSIKRVVLPMCADGVATGCILSVGRILGESAALLFTAGFSHAVSSVSTILAKPGSSLSVALYVYAKEQGEFSVAFAIGSVLIVLSLLINIGVELVKKRK